MTLEWELAIVRREAREEALEEGREEGIKKGMNEGIKEGRLGILKQMLKTLTMEQILALGFTKEEINEAEAN